MKLFAYDDVGGWGKAISASFSNLGHKTKLFTSANEVPEGPDVVCFVHMYHQPEFRTKHKRMMEELDQKELLLIPSIKEARLYDDKVKQFQTFPKWMPKTWHIENFEEAVDLASKISYPMISKSADGAGSSNIRFIKNKEQAIREVHKVFSVNGIRLHYPSTYQKGYILWQEFLAGNTNDWRVILLAKKYAIILKRENRSNIPFASGSGVFTQITKLNDEMTCLLDFTLSFVSESNLLFTGVDIVYDKKNDPVVLEYTCGWGFDAYANCRFFEYEDNKWILTKYIGRQTFDVVSKAILAGEFDS